MKTPRHVLILGLVCATAAFAADLNVAGNLTVTGTVDSDGNTTSFGVKNAGSPTLPGVVFTYTDNSVPTGAVDSFQFLINRNPASWLWLHNTATTGTYNAMRLDEAHQLILYRSDGTTAGLTFTPQTSVIKLGTNASATLTGDTSTGLITAGGGLTVSGAFTATTGITNTNGSLTGGASGLMLNSGTSGTNLTLTAAGAGDIVFNTNSLERMRIKSTGNVGIGVPGPLTKLDVRGNSATADATVQIVGTGISTLLLGQDSNGGVIRGQGGNNNLRFLVGGSGDQAASGSGTEAIRILSSGNVGIGTANPQVLLHLSSNANPSTGLSIENTAAGGRWYSFVSTQNGAGIGGGKFSLYDNTAAAHRLTVDSAGNIGIGTTSPTALLDIFRNGTTQSALNVRNTIGGVTLFTDNGYSGIFQSANIPLIFYTNSAERIRVDGSGNIGIGTASPGAQLELYRTAGVAPALRLNTNFGGGNAVDFNPFITGVNNGGFELAIAGTRRLVIDPTGNVGIGTTTPSSLLDLYSPTAGYAYTGYQAYAGATHWYVGSGNSGVTIQDFGIGQSNIGNNPKLMIAYSTGNVGIGTTNPTQKLSVAGTIRAYEVIVDTGWADYVFDPNYRLAPLSEVEQHIKTEKHLPGIPSAAEIAEHGVSMGDMQSRLLSKIEELTLHMIAQEKHMTSQEKQLTAQAARIEQLERDNAALQTR